MAFLLEPPTWADDAYDFSPRMRRHFASDHRKDACMLPSIAVICIGASLGALLRWTLGLSLNALYPAIPLGTLAANLVGGYLVGVAVAVFANYPALSPEWRLLVITGFLGGLTTFSTFSAETVNHIMDGNLFAAMGVIAAHVVGSLLLTLLGIGSVALIRSMATAG